MYAPHYDPMMISTQAGLCKIERILLDVGGGYNIMFSNCFEQMQFPEDVIKTDAGGVCGFDGHESNPIGHVSVGKD